MKRIGKRELVIDIWDYLGDVNLRCCSMAAQGFWIRLLMYMMQERPYGTWGGVISINKMFAIIGVTPEKGDLLLHELITCGVCSLSPTGIVYCEKIIEEQKIIEKRIAAGSKGRRPSSKK